MDISTCVCDGTPFRLVSEASEDAIQELMHQHMDGYLVDLDVYEQRPDGSRSYSLAMDAEDVGNSFGGRLTALVSAMAPHVLDAFRVTVRTDSMSDDDRDLVLFGGPDNQSILEFQTQCAVKDAMELLRGADLKAAMLQALLNYPDLQGIAPKMPASRVFLSMNGGTLGSAVSSMPVEITVIDYDTDGCSPDDLSTIPGADGVSNLAFVRRWVAEVNPARCEQLEAAARADREWPVLLGFSADGYWSNDLGWVESAQDASLFDATQAPILMQLQLLGSGVCVLKVDQAMVGSMLSIGGIEERIDNLLSDRGGVLSEEAKGQFLLDMRSEFFLLNEEQGAFAPAILALLAREQTLRLRITDRPS